MLRYLWAVTAVVVVLLASATGVGQRDARASEELYDSEELRLLQLIN